MAGAANDRDLLIEYVQRLGDTALVLSQRLMEIVASAPELEEELANANLALDYLGQARLFYSYAAEVEGKNRTEDDFAFLREAPEFHNALLVEQANGHFGDTIVRQVLFDAFYLELLQALAQCREERLAAIAAIALKEIRYHWRHASQWLIRLGDGTDESHRRVQASLHRLWRYTDDLFDGDRVDEYIKDNYDGPDLTVIRASWRQSLTGVLAEARLSPPDGVGMQYGGRQGRHGEAFGFLVAEMQHLQRTYLGANW